MKLLNNIKSIIQKNPINTLGIVIGGLLLVLMSSATGWLVLCRVWNVYFYLYYAPVNAVKGLLEFKKSDRLIDLINPIIFVSVEVWYILYAIEVFSR